MSEDTYGRRIFIGGLDGNEDVNALTQILREALDSCGKIEDVFIPRDYETGASRGIAFVTFIDEISARAAISQYEGGEIDGHKVTVSLARPKPTRTF